MWRTVLRRSTPGVRAVLVACLAAGVACAEPPAAEDPADTATWSTGTTEVAAGAPGPPIPVLTALRTGTHDEGARVTFEVDAQLMSARPGYHVEYVDRPLIACGSGEQIFPVGDAWLRVRMSPAAAHTASGEATLGPREIAVDGPLLLRIYRTCDFEGVVTHVLALSAPNPYRVFTLENPLRIVVDVER